MLKNSRVIAFILTVTLFIEMSVSPSIWAVNAKETEDASEETPELLLSEEKVAEKGENYTVYENGDGTETLEIYTGDIRVEDENGELVDVDNTLEETELGGEKAYTNVSGFADVVLPETLTAETPVIIGAGSGSIKMIPAFGEISIQADSSTSLRAGKTVKRSGQTSGKERSSKSSDEVKENTGQANAADSENLGSDDEEGSEDDTEEATSEEAEERPAPVSSTEEAYPAYEEAEYAYEEEAEDNEDSIEIEGEEELKSEEVIEEETEDLYGKEEEKPTGIRYSTPDPNVYIEYYPIDSGVKENIVLEDEPDSNVFSFVIKAKGRYLEKEHKGIVFKDINTEKVKAAIQEPFMTDSSKDGGYSEDLEYSIEEIDRDKGIYRVDLSVDEEYLEDKDRVYPVTIDPTVYTANNTSTITDAYVLSKHSGTNYYSSAVKQMVIGYSKSDGICRTFMKFPNLKTKISGAYIESAYLRLKERSNTKPYATVGIHRVTKTWTLSKLKYSNQPTFLGAVNTKTLTGSRHTV